MEYTFTGNVVDSDGQPLIGAHVITVNAPKKGVITDFDGNFTVNGPLGEAYEISHVGYIDQLLRIDRFRTTGKFILEDDAFELDEVVLTPRKQAPKTIVPIARNIAPATPKKGLLDLIKENPLVSTVAIGVGLWAVITLTATTTSN